MAKEEKQHLRREVAKRIAALTPADRMLASRDICKALVAMPQVKSARQILCYSAMPDEVDLWPAIELFALDDKGIYLPRCKGNDIECVRFESQGQLAASGFGIMEPSVGEIANPSVLDLVLAPARAFDLNGRRLGRGASFYDRFFSAENFKVLKCGVAFDFQIFDSIPAEKHDIPVDVIVTEKRIISCGR